MVNRVVSQSRRKQRKRHFSAPSHERRIIMSASLSKELREKFQVRAVPIRKGDEVKVLVGKFKGKEGKVKQVFRKKYKIYINGLTVNKVNGQSVEAPIHPSNVSIKKLHMDKNRKSLLARKSRNAREAEKNLKISEESVKMQE